MTDAEIRPVANTLKRKTPEPTGEKNDDLMRVDDKGHFVNVVMVFASEEGSYTSQCGLQICWMDRAFYRKHSDSIRWTNCCFSLDGKHSHSTVTPKMSSKARTCYATICRQRSALVVDSDNESFIDLLAESIYENLGDVDTDEDMDYDTMHDTISDRNAVISGKIRITTIPKRIKVTIGGKEVYNEP